MWRFYQPIHPQWLIAVVGFGFVCGVAAALMVRIPWQWGIGVLLVMGICFWWARAYLLPLLLGCSVVLGLGYGSVCMGERDVYRSLIGKQVTVRGKVKEDIGKSSSGRYSMQLDTVTVQGEALPGVLLVATPKTGGALRGDFVVVSGRMKEGFGSFPASMSVLGIDRVIRQSPGDVGRVVRDWFGEKVRQVIAEPQASLGIGFLTGQKSALPDDLSESLKIAGLTHIVVASGYNLTILVRMARRLFAKVSKYLSALSAGIMIASFVMITGLSPSMTRAELVSSLSLLAWYYGHAFHPLVLLPLAAAVTVAFQPSYVWGDMGWQLSFAAFAGVMIVAPLLQRYFFGNKDPGVVRQILGETVAAHLVTVPIIAISFGVLSNVAIIANILVVPLVPLAMLLTFLCGICSIAGISFLAELIAMPTMWLLGYMTHVATYVAELEWAQWELSLPGWMWALYVLILIGACLWMQRATRYDLRNANPII